MIVPIMATIFSLSVFLFSNITQNNNDFSHVKQVIDRADCVKATSKRKVLYEKYSKGNGEGVDYIKKQYELVTDTNITAYDKDLLTRLQNATKKVVIENNNNNPTCDSLVATGYITLQECEKSKLTKRNYLGFDYNISNEDSSVISVLNANNLTYKNSSGEVRVYIPKDAKSETKKIEEERNSLLSILEYAKKNISDSEKVLEVENKISKKSKKVNKKLGKIVFKKVLDDYKKKHGKQDAVSIELDKNLQQWK